MPQTIPDLPVGKQVPSKDALLELFSFGFDHWLVEKNPTEVIERLANIGTSPLGQAQLNQLLHLCHEPGVSQGFFRYYWLTRPFQHAYDVSLIQGFNDQWLDGDLIKSLDQLKWGLYRLYVDALLFFGDVRIAFKKLRTCSESDLANFFQAKRFNTADMIRRGPALPLNNIVRDDRYLISEMACKSYVGLDGQPGDLRKYLLEAFLKHKDAGGGKVKIRKLFEASLATYNHRQTEFLFSADGILEDEIEDVSQIEEKYDSVFRKFEAARKAALKNTEYFLSMVNDLDVYVATSMRDRQDFRKMADFCQDVFKAPSLAHLSLRYFDPTMSAAEGHEDKGLIECLMVKSAKVLVYCAGVKDSFGKDAEATMALSLGKPVIFFCDENNRQRFFSDVHPLSRLIEFNTGVAVGAMVTSSTQQVVELLRRIFGNEMRYELHQKESGLRLLEKLTGSVVRLQTRNALLRETFWNYYNTR